VRLDEGAGLFVWKSDEQDVVDPSCLSGRGSSHHPAERDEKDGDARQPESGHPVHDTRARQIR
jgi:hypothetical protein